MTFDVTDVTGDLFDDDVIDGKVQVMSLMARNNEVMIFRHKMTSHSFR